MRVRFINTDHNIYIEVSGTMVGCFTRKWNKNLYCHFFKDYPLSLAEVTEICDKMEELNGT